MWDFIERKNGAKEVLFEELIDDAEVETEHDFGNNILPHMLRSRRLFAFGFIDENRGKEPCWRDIGTLDAYYKANMDLTAVCPDFDLYSEHWPIRSYQPPSPPAKMVFADEGDGARRGEALDSMISNGCIVSGGRVIRSVLSPQVRINSHSLVEDSILLAGVDVGRYAKIRKAIVDKHVRIPSGMTIGYDLEEDRKRFTVTGSGLVVINKGMVVASEKHESRRRGSTADRQDGILRDSHEAGCAV